jgi:hypothetical protein
MLIRDLPKDQHPYPPAYKPGVHWAFDEAWDILDRLPVGMLPNDYRFLLAGQIAGTLMRVMVEGPPAMRAKNG